MAVNPLDKLSPPAQLALNVAYQLLMMARQDNLEAEHLLLAMLQQNDPTTLKVVEAAGARTEEVQQAVQEAINRIPAPVQPGAGFRKAHSASLFITPRLLRMLAQAYDESQARQAEAISTGHLLLAMTTGHDPAGLLLKEYGVTRAVIEGVLKPERPTPPEPEADPTPPLTHFNESGRARMVDVSEKDVTGRRAVAQGEITMTPATLALIREGRAAKGDVLAVAQVAGIMAAKKTHELIPMCHPLLLTGVDLRFEYDDERLAVLIEAEVKTSGQTGVEMEALTAVSAAALTIYDMVKAADRTMQIGAIRLTHKSGGKSGTFEAE